MEEFNVFIVIVVLVVSILQIILFFKLWKMTNDTAAIKGTVGNMKGTVESLLYSQIPEEKRKHATFIEVFEMLWSQNVIKINQLPTSEPERTKELKKELAHIFDLNKRAFTKIIEKNVVSSVYTIEKLEEDIVNEYKKKIAE